MENLIIGLVLWLVGSWIVIYWTQETRRTGDWMHPSVRKYWDAYFHGIWRDDDSSKGA